MGLSEIGHTLPPGFRFNPSDEELVCHYLYKKIVNEQVDDRDTLVEIDLHICEPWQLPDMAKLNSREWYFFSFRDRKYATGYRTNRATTSGYWKATGKDRPVQNPSTRAVVGMRKTLVFYKHRAPNGQKTGWIMHEFRLENPHLPPKEDWVLCRVFYKSTGENCNNNFNPHNNLYEQYSNSTLTSDQHAFTSYNYQNITSYSHTQSNDHQQYGHNPNPNSVGLSDLDQQYPSTSNDHHNFDSLLSTDQSKCEDDYGFLFDMNFDCSNDGALLNFDMM